MSERDDIEVRDDMDEGPHVHFIETAEPDDDPLRLLTHLRANPHDRAHVDLTQDEYSPEEAARLIGTSVEVIMHAVRNGELKATRAGTDVVCIKHEDLVDWLRRRGSGV